jgi:HD-like signal output (HDOD) protein
MLKRRGFRVPVVFKPMKKRICFAGFGVAEIESLRPEFAAVNSSWECVFCRDGAAALESMAQGPFAALVADLRMEGMSGVGLLQIAASDFPHTVRFALGDFSDREAVVTNIGAPHQFISRPWKVADLVTLIERSLALDAWLSSDKLRKFVPQLGRLPGLPSTYFEVLKRAESPKANAAEIGEIIARDPALTARVLQTVNSAAAALGEKITNPVEAVSVLGLDTIKSLVLCLQVFSQSAPALPTGITLDDLWRHSFAVGQLSRKIALLQTSDSKLANDAFTAGLLHRVGQIVLTTNMAREYGEIVAAARQEKQPLHDVEIARLGVSSAQVGAYLLGLWGMPLALIEADALYNEPGRVAAREFSLLTAVHVADVLAQEDRPLAEGLSTPHLNREYLRALGLPDKTDLWRKALVGGQFSSPPPPPPPPEGAETAAPSQDLARDKSNSPPRPAMAWLVIAIVVIALGLLAWKRFSPSAPPEKTPFAAGDATVSPTPAGKPEAPVETDADAQAEAAAFDAIKIQGIIYSSSRPVALINGHPVSPGDKIGGVQIIAINASNVVVSYQGRQHILKWK